MGGLFWTSYAVLWAIVVIQGLAFLEVLRQLGLLRKHIGPQQGAAIMSGTVPTGAVLPPAFGRSAVGMDVDWDVLIRTRRGIAVFLTPTCVTCREIAADLKGFTRDVPRDVTVVAFVKGTSGDVESFLEATRLPREFVVIDEEGGTANALGIGWTPAALTIEEGRVGVSAIINSIYQLDSLVQEQFEADGSEPTLTTVHSDVFEARVQS